MDQSIHEIGGEGHSGPGLQALAVEDPSNLGTRVIVQQLIDFFYGAVRGSSPMTGIQWCGDRQGLRGATSELQVAYVVPLNNGHVLDQQTNHPLPFPVGQSRIVPDLPKISRQGKDLPTLRIAQDEMI